MTRTTVAMYAVAFVLLGLLAACSAPSAQPAQSSREQPAAAGAKPITVDSTEEQIRQAVATARMGRKLTPKTWPNGARIAVCLTFDVDNELLQRANPLPVPLSVGEYGATTSVPRILDVLDRHQVPATFFVPAMSSMLHPDMVAAIVSRGRHEIGVHGWIHEFWPGVGDAAQEERLLTQSIDYLTKAAGKRPVGVRAPSSGFSPHTFDLIRKYGPDYKVVFVGDASMSPYEIVQPGGSVEHWNEESGAAWLARVLAHWPNAIWLNPTSEKHWAYTHSIGLMRARLGVA